MYEGFNIFEGTEPEPGPVEPREAGRHSQPSEPAPSPEGEELGSAESVDGGEGTGTDIFGAEERVDARRAGPAEADRGDVRSRVRVVVLGGLAIVVLALAGTLFGSGGGHRAAPELTGPDARPPVVSKPDPRAVSPRRRPTAPPPSRLGPRPEGISGREGPISERPVARAAPAPSGTIAAPVPAAVPVRVPVPVRSSPVLAGRRPVSQGPSREFDFER